MIFYVYCSLAISRVVSGQSVDSKGHLPVDRNEADAFQKAFGFISRTVSTTFDLITELYSSQFLSEEKVKNYLEKFTKLRDEGKHLSEQDKYTNSEILFEVKKVISERPNKFDDFCAVLERLDYVQCANKLRGM